MFSLEWLRTLIPETVPDRDKIISSIMAEKGTAITAAVAAEALKYADYAQTKAELTTAKTTLEGLKGLDIEGMKTKLKAFEDAEVARKAKDDADKVAKAMAARFAAVKGTNEFIDPLMEEVVLNKFTAMIADPANEGKGDAELYALLTKDKPFFKSQNPPSKDNMGKPGGSADYKGLTKEDAIKLSLTDRMKLKSEAPDVYAKYFPSKS